MNNEHRTAKRITFQTLAKIHHGGDQQLTATVKTQNISLKGVFLDCADQLPLGTPCDIDISLKGATSTLQFNVSGHVCRNESDGFAVAFKGLNPDSYAHITNLMVLESSKRK